MQSFKTFVVFKKQNSVERQSCFRKSEKRKENYSPLEGSIDARKEEIEEKSHYFYDQSLKTRRIFESAKKLAKEVDSIEGGCHFVYFELPMFNAQILL